jgi:hypothetical protein
MYVLIFATNIDWNISTSKTISARYCHKYANAFMWSTRYSCEILRKLDLSGQIFEKYSNSKYHENPSSGSRDVSCGRTNGNNEGVIVAFRDFANPPKKGTSVSYTAPNTPRYGCNDNTSPDSWKWIYHFFNLSCRMSAWPHRFAQVDIPALIGY